MNDCFNNYFCSSCIETIRALYVKGDDNIEITSGCCYLIKTPFRVIKVRQFLNNPVYLELLKNTISELQFFRKDNDLYSLMQSYDLKSCDHTSIQTFIRHLTDNVRPKLEQIVGYDLSPSISITASIYRNGDYLLCHDDRCEDRAVAFVYYLSESVDFNGSFDMFGHDNSNNQPTEVIQRISNEADCIIFFEVGSLTYHQVSEVCGDYLRVSLNGWFHRADGFCGVSKLAYKEEFPVLERFVQLKGICMLDDFIQTVLTTPTSIVDICKTFEETSSIDLPDFLDNKLFQQCFSSLQSDDIYWNKKGPPNRRNYCVTKSTDDLPEPVQHLANFFKSGLFISYLKNITGLSLVEPSFKCGSQSIDYGCICEIRKLTCGSYTMATDDNPIFHKTGLDVFLFFVTADINKETGGFLSYLATDDENSLSDDCNSSESDSSNELITIFPENNHLYAVYRTSGTIHFLKYVNKTFVGDIYCLTVTYYEE